MKDMTKDVLEFIGRRFPKDSDWTNGNCYYFAKILQARFGGDVVYDVVYGHFLLRLNGQCYDYNGVFVPVYIEEWDNYEDIEHKQRIIEGCIK